MSFYNMLAGMNAELGLIISCVTKRRIDRYFPRFRDVFTNDDDCPIKDYDYLIYTRMGGGNYECWGHDDDQITCPYCILKRIEKIKSDTYLGGYNDEFDSTYRTLAFKFTPEQKEKVDRIKNGEGLLFLKDEACRLFPKIFNAKDMEAENESSN